MRGLPAIREVIEQLRGPLGQDADERPKGSDVRDAVLGVLAEEPSNGYRIVRVLEERGRSGRTPGAGAVYPTLQLLADEGLATAAETDGRKTWTLTPAGHAAAEAALSRTEQTGPSASRSPERRGAIARSAGQLGQAVALAAQTAAPHQHGEVVAVLDEARRKVLAILARS